MAFRLIVAVPGILLTGVLVFTAPAPMAFTATVALLAIGAALGVALLG